MHIPGSYPVKLCKEDDAGCDSYALDYFVDSAACRNSRIFVHCWSGKTANQVAVKLVALGFTNLHLAGPEGAAGINFWDADVYPLSTYGHEWDSSVTPRCYDQCA